MGKKDAGYEKAEQGLSAAFGSHREA